jgi:CubicO group peptidase (beta-lactamase class C family)
MPVFTPNRFGFIFFFLRFAFPIFLLAGCRAVVRNVPDIDDYKFFVKAPIPPGSEPFRFVRTAGGPDLGKTIMLRKEAWFHPLEDVLKEMGTAGFMIIRRDTVLYEYYGKGFIDTSFVASFSVAKAFTSAIAGALVGEGIIQLTDPVTKFVPELKDRKGLDQVQLKHLLNMTSGLKYANNERFIVEASKFYYGRELEETLLKGAEAKRPPGTEFEYLNGNTMLAAMMMERASGKKMYKLLQEKIWHPLGMESHAIWGADNKKDTTVRAFCCLYARTEDYAKFGRLYLRGGEWNGKQVLPREWVEKSLMNNARYGPQRDYHFHWMAWAQDYDAHLVGGLFNQYLLIYPKKDLIIVHFSKKHKQDSGLWRSYFLQLMDMI